MTLSEVDIIAFENRLHLLNYRWNLAALSAWTGEKPLFTADEIYPQYEEVLNFDMLDRLEGVGNAETRNRLKHAWMDHYLQRLLLPHENEMRAWMKGAAAHVNGKKIYFREIIPWCQKTSTYQTRQLLQKETAPLCKFLKPFALNYWSILLEALRRELGFDNYVAYCSHKKGIDYADYYQLMQRMLEDTAPMYFTAMNRWSRNRFQRPMQDLTRYDAINLLGFGEFDPFFPKTSIEELSLFFSRCWDIDLNHTPGLTLKIENKLGKSAQAMCFLLQIPEEVYVVMRPAGGWIDLESFWHELGHGLSAVFTSADLSISDRDLATSFSLSESYAFLLQNIAMSRFFMEKDMHLTPVLSQKIHYCKVLRDLSVFRRYAAKFIAEYDMFSKGNLADGRPYAELMTRHTGFYHQPETHLFDLVPEFYCLDYILGWMAEAILDQYLRQAFGPEWPYHSKSAAVLKHWWSQGNREDLPRFTVKNGLGDLTPDILMDRWEKTLV